MQKKIKIIVVGGSKAIDYVVIKKNIINLLEIYRYFDYGDVTAEIIAIESNTIGSFAKEVAKEYSIPFVCFSSNYDVALDYAKEPECFGILLAFNDDNPKINDIINKANDKNIQARIVKY